MARWHRGLVWPTSLLSQWCGSLDTRWPSYGLTSHRFVAQSVVGSSKGEAQQPSSASAEDDDGRGLEGEGGSQVYVPVAPTADVLVGSPKIQEDWSTLMRRRLGRLMAEARAVPSLAHGGTRPWQSTCRSPSSAWPVRLS
jgi:hypothetical protein